MTFALERVCPVTGARTGVLTTPHGPVRTPAFLPVASQGSVKAVAPWEVRETGAELVLANVYHLYLRPGISVVEGLGGIHRFMGWDGPILTDSGGFQAFSLSALRRVTDDGIHFKSHIDGSMHFLTPEASVHYQEALGSDIAMVLDQCPAYSEEYQGQRRAMQRTHRWAERCLKAHQRGGQALFGIVQGGVFRDLREESVRALTSLDFPGYGIGGLGVGEPKALMYPLAEFTAALLPADRPRYLMGVGSPEDLVECVARGIDLFDCSLPTRVARNGSLFTPQGRLDITMARFREEGSPVDPACDCSTCQRFSAAYLCHLFRAKELLAYRLATVHNLRFVLRLMQGMRYAIIEGTFAAFREAFLGRYQPTDEATRLAQRERWREGRLIDS